MNAIKTRMLAKIFHFHTPHNLTKSSYIFVVIGTIYFFRNCFKLNEFQVPANKIPFKYSTNFTTIDHIKFLILFQVFFIYSTTLLPINSLFKHNKLHKKLKPINYAITFLYKTIIKFNRRELGQGTINIKISKKLKLILLFYLVCVIFLWLFRKLN
jgi:hypothetical protein